jgi:hypothetical protein
VNNSKGDSPLQLGGMLFQSSTACSIAKGQRALLKHAGPGCYGLHGTLSHAHLIVCSNTTKSNTLSLVSTILMKLITSKGVVISMIVLDFHSKLVHELLKGMFSLKSFTNL